MEQGPSGSAGRRNGRDGLPQRRERLETDRGGGRRPWNADIGEDASEAYVRLHPDGTALIFSCLTEHGTGQKSNLMKMAAEVLQIPWERVSIVPPDSLINPYEFGPVGSADLCHRQRRDCRRPGRQTKAF